MVRFRLLCGDFLLPNPAPHLENRMTVCMGYPAMTPQGRAGKRRRKGAGNPCRENGRTLISQLRSKTMWSKWSHRFSVTLQGLLKIRLPRGQPDSDRNRISGSKWPTEKAGRADGQGFANLCLSACPEQECRERSSLPQWYDAVRHILLGIIWRKTAADPAAPLLRSPTPSCWNERSSC